MIVSYQSEQRIARLESGLTRVNELLGELARLAKADIEKLERRVKDLEWRLAKLERAPSGEGPRRSPGKVEA